MKVKKYLVTILLLALFIPFSVKAISHTKSVITQRELIMYNSITQTYDKGYVAVGEYSIFVPIITKYDSEGNITWEKQIKDDYFGGFGKVIEDKNNNIIAVGFLADPQILYIVKYNKDGKKLWDEKIGTTEPGGPNGEYNDIVEYNGNYLTVGYYRNNYVYKGTVTIYNSDGERIYTQIFSESEFNYVDKVLLTDDGGYVIAGTIGNNIKIAKYTSNHTLIWQNQYDSSYQKVITDFDIDNSGNFIVSGYENTSQNSYYNPLVIKYDTNGVFKEKINFMFEKFYIPSISSLNVYPSIKLKFVEENKIIMTTNNNKTGYFYVLNNNYEVEWMDKLSDSKNNFYSDFIVDGENYVVLKNVLDDDTTAINEMINGSLVKYSKVKEQEIFKSDWVDNYTVFDGAGDPSSDFSIALDISFFGSLATTEDGFVVSQYDSEYFNSTLTSYSFNGKKMKTIEEENLFMVDLVADDNNIFVLALSDNDDNPFLLKYDYDLNKIEEVQFESDSGFIIDATKLYSLNVLRIYENNIYVVNKNVTGIYEYDNALNYKREYLLSNDLDFISNIFPEFNELFLNPEIEIFGYDRENEYEVYNFEDEYGSYIKVNKNGVEIVKKRIDNYLIFGTSKIVGDYIVSIGFLNNTIPKSEIVIMDMECNILQVIENDIGYFKIINRENSFATLGVNNEKCDNDTDCVSAQLEFFYLPLNIENIGSDKGVIELNNEAKPGEKVSFVVTPKKGYIYKGLKIIDADGNETIVTSNSFIMPEENITIEPIFVIANPNTITFLKLGFIAVIIFAIYNLFISRKIKIKRFA